MEKNYSPKHKKSNFNTVLSWFLVLFAVLFFNQSAYSQDCSVNAGIPSTICANAPLVLNGVVGGKIRSHTWTQTAGPSVVIQNPNSAVTSVLGAVGGNTYTFRLSGVCAIGTTFQDVTITVNPITIAKAGNNIQGCPGSYALSANAPLNPGETGQWEKSGADNAGVIINNPNSPNTTISLSSSAAGTTQLTWRISSSSCSSSSSITVTNYGGEVVAKAGDDQTLSECYTATQSAGLNASIGGNGTGTQQGTWSFVSGPTVPTITNPNTPNATVSNLTQGSYVFRWLVQGPCAVGSDTVTINVPAATQDVTTAGGTNTSQSFCDNSITSTILQGNTPLYAGETVEWTTNSGATIVSPNSPTTQITGLNFNSNQTYTFIYKIKGNSAVNPNCETQSTFTVRYVSSPTGLTLNSGGSTIVLPVNATSGNVSMSSTGGNASDAVFINGPAGVTPSLSFNGGNFAFSNLTKPGTYTFRVRRYTSGSFATGCSEAFASINVVVSLSPEPSNAGTRVALLCGVTSTQLSGNNPASMSTSGLSGYWSQVSGPNAANFDNINNYNPNVSGLIPGVYVFRWNISGGPNAVDTFSETSITVSQPPVANAGTTPVTVCAGSYFLDAAPLVDGQTGQWTQVGGTPAVSIENATSPQTYVNGMLESSSYTFRWTVTSAATNCAPASSDVVVNTTTTFSPSPANAGSDRCLPSGTTTAVLAATAPATGTTGTWSQVSGPSTVVFSSINNPNATVSGLLDGVYKFQWTTETDPGCSTFSDTTTLTIAATPTSAAGANQDVCTDSSGNSVVMNANTLTAGLVGTWVQVSGNSFWTISDVHDPKAVFSNLAPGNYVFKWVVNRGTCDSASSEVSFKVSLPPTIAVVTSSPMSVCTTTANLTGNTITAGVGTWQVVSGPNNPIFANVNSGTTSVSGLTTGTYILRWSSTNGPSCATSTADLTLDVNAPADAGPDQDFCNATEIILQGTKGSTGTWTVNSGAGATITPLSSSTARATIVPGNNYTFQYSIASAGSCGATSDTMIVTNSALPTTPNAGADENICLSNGTSTNLSGNSITSGTGTWSKVSGPTGGVIASPNSSNTAVTGLTEGLYIFKWTASNGSCNNLSDVVRINAYSPPSTANAGADQSACQLATQLDAVAPTRGIGTWTLTTDPSNGGIVIDSPNNPKSTLTIANPYLLPVGTYTFTWTVKNGPICDESKDNVNITFTGAPPTPANAGPDQNLCNAASAVMNANPVNPGTGTWTQVSGPTTAIFSNKFSAQATVSGLTNGTYEFKWSSSNGGGCNLEDTMLVIINPAIASVNAGPDQTLGEYATVTMAATNPAPNTGTWSFVSGPNTPVILDVNSPTTQIAGTIPGKYIFKFTVSNGSCAVDSDTVEITLIGQTDLSLVKTADITTPRVGDIVTFTVAVTNNGNRNATGIAVRDNLPAGFTLIAGSVSNQGNFNAGGNAINWSGLSVVNGAALNLTYKARVNAATGTANEYTNTAQITASDQVDPNSTPNNNIPTEDDQDSVTLTPIPNVDLAITKRINNATPDVGSTVQFTIEVVNNGPSTATSVVATDALPTGYTFVSATVGTGAYNSTNGRWSIGNLVNGARTTLTITARVNATGVYTNTATVTRAEVDTNSTNNTSSVSSTPRAIADLSLTKVVSAGPYNVGSNATFTVTVTNAGPSAATSVSLLDYLPSGYTYVSHTSSTGTTYSNASGSWNIGTIANGGSSVLTVVARINAAGDYRNVAEIVHSNEFDPDSVPGNNNAAEDDQQQVVITPVQLADLEVTKTVDVAAPRVGDNIKFRIALRNVGPSDATGVIVNDLLPSGYTFVSYTSTNGAYNATNGNWTISGSVLNGKTEYLDITAKVNPITGTANEYRNTASVTASNQTDPNPANNSSTVTTVPTPLINLSLTKAVNNISPSAGSNVVFTVTVSNAGPSNATGVQVRDLLPNGYTYVSSTVSNGTYTNGTGLWAIGTIANGASAVLNVTARVNATGNYTNVAEVISANETDANSTPNNNVLTEDDQDQITISRGPLVDLSLIKTVNTNTPNVNDIVNFTITVRNAGPSDATGVVVTDKLPSGYLFVNAAPSVGSYNNTPGSWTLGTLVNGATATLNIQARVLPTGNYNNVAEVTGANEVDSNSTPGNNDAAENDQSEVIVTPIQIADLSVNKIVDVTAPKVGDNVVFTISVSNAGPSNATGVVIRDLLSSGYEFVNAVPTAGLYNRTTGDWTVSRPIIANTTETIQITAKVLKNGSYVNNAEVIASDQQDPDSTPNDGTGDDFSTVTTTPSALVNLAVVKRINNATPDVGSTVVFTIDVVNNGPSDATNVVVNDRLPSGYTFVSDDAAGSYINASGNWTIGNLASGARRTLNISATVNPTGIYLNTATATSTETDGNLTDNTSEVSSTPRAIADLSLTKVVSAGPHNVGSNATFTVTVTNAGPSAATSVSVLDYLPSGYTYVSHTSSTGTTYSNASGSWNIGTIANGGSSVLTVTARINAAGDYRNVAEIVHSNEFDPDSVPGNNNAAEDDQQQVVITPVQLADLEVTKTVDVAAPRVGDNIKFRIALRNVGPSDATGVIVNELLPSGYTFVSYTSTNGAYNATNGNWTISGSVLNGKTEYLDITAKVNPITGTANEYRNTASVTASNQTDPNPANNSSTVTTVPTPLINLSLTKAVNNISPSAGSNVVFTVTVSNAGPSNATGVQVRDLLPNGYTYVSSTVSNGTYTNGTGLWAIGTIANGASAVLNVTARVNATGNYTNVAEVISANETDANSTPNNNVLTEDDQDQITISRGPLVDLSLIKTVNANTPNVNDIVNFTITVRNAGPSDATGVVVTDKLPSGYLFVNAAPSVGSYNNTPGSWTLGTLVNGATATLDIQARVLPTGNYNNVAEVTGANEVDSNSTPGNNDAAENDQSEVIVTPIQIADLSVNKIVDVTAPKVGDNVVFTISVSNAGPSNATGVVIRDLLSSGYEFVNAVPTAGLYNRTTGDWTVSRPIIANTTETIQITAKVLKNGSYVNNAEVIASDQQDPDSTPNDGTGDDFSTVTTTPSALVNLAVVKRINNATPDVGSTVVFTIDVVNNGPSDATNVVVNDRLPTGYNYVSDDAAGSYINASGNWTIGNLASGAKRTLNISATVNPTGIYLNTATATSTETDGNLTDNNSEVSSTPRAIADLSLVKTVANASPNVGENAIFTIVVTNNGPSNATGVVVTDKLPSGYSFVSATPSVGTYDSNSGGWSVGNLANSASASLTITARVLSTGNYNNVAEVTGSDQFDPNSIPGNNNPLENDQSTVVVTPVNVADLVTVKTVSAVAVTGISASRPNEGDTIKYSIVVTNNGGPTSATGVSLTDIIPAGLTYESYTVTAGAYNYASGVWTIGNLGVNGTATLEITAKVNAGTKGLTIINRTTAAKGDQTDPTTVGDDLEETIVVSLPPIATNDISNGNTTNQPSTPLNILTNDRLGDGTLATPANTIVDLNPNTPGVETTITVSGEGTWNYDSATGLIVFTPQVGFTSNPTPLVYKLTETQTGLSDTATITVTYIAQAPIAYNDLSSGNPVNTAVTVNPLANNGSGIDSDPDGTIDASTVRLLNPSGATAIVSDSKGITSFDVPNEGKWSVNPVTGAITFTPLPTFHKDPAPIQYNVKDNDGNISNNAMVTIDYVPVAANDRNTTPGTPSLPVTINVSGNDVAGDTVNVATVVLNASSVFGGIQVSPQEVSVVGVGSWIADALGNVTFTPEVGYTIDPPVISYTIKDNQGNSSNTATITIDYAPITSPDLSIGNPINTPVVVDVTANDTTGDLVDPTTVSLVNPGNGTNIVQDPSGDITSITIPGEGRWNVDLVNGRVTFTPNRGFITDPTPINYTIKDHEGNLSNNSVITIRVIPQADLVVTKTDNKDKYVPGTNSVYTITVKNNGPAAATNVVMLDDITDPVLEAVTTWTAVGTGGTILPYANGTGDINAGNATISSINVGETVTYTVTIAVPSSYTGQIVNAASATSAVQDPNSNNNTQTDIDTVNALAEIALTKTIVTAAPHRIGDNVEFLITAVNNGPSDATGINIVDKLPSGYTFVSVTPSRGTYNASNGLWNLGNLTNTSTATLTVIARINATGNYTNVAEVTKVDQLDPNGVIHGNNTPNEIDQSDVTIVPVKIVDLVTTKTVDKSNPNQGDIVQYTITVVNNGPSTATGVNLTDNLPAGLAYVSHVATGGTTNTYAGGQWNIGNINIGSSATLLINARVTAAGTVGQTPIINTVTPAVGNELDPTTVGDDLTEPIIVTSSDLVTEKTVSKSNPSEGETITYSIRVTNNGPSDATGVRLTDILPIGVTYVSNNQGADYNYGSGIWTIGNLVNGATKVLNINVVINSGSAGKTIVNTTTAAKGDQSDPSTTGDDLTETIIVQNGADVVLKKVVNNSTPNIGETVTYTVTVTNKGTTLVTNLVVKDDLPAGLTFVSATPGKGVWTTPNWTVGTLQPGEEGSIEIKALVGLDQGGNVLTNTVSNTQDQFDTNRTLDDPTETITVTNLDLAVVKTVNNARPNEGETIRYTIRVTNNGASDATNVSLVDKLPVGVTYVSDVVSAGSYNNGSGLWTIGNLVNGAVATLTIDAKVNAGTYGTTITNTTSAVKADQADSNIANNIGSVAIVPTAYIDLSLTKEIVGNVTNPAVGDVITFEIRVMNDGPTKATGVEVVDLIPSGYKFINYSSTIGTYSPSTGLWKVGFVEPGNTAVLLVDVRVLDNGNYMNCAEITKANEPDIDSTPGNGNDLEDDYACAAAAPNQSVDLAIVKTILKNTMNPKVNSEISFEILLTNNGDIDATGVVVSDLLPSGYTFVNYSSTRGAYDYVTGDWKVGKILNGETEILIVDVIVNESGNYQNCASIKAMHQTDVDPANNKSCITAAPIAVIDLELTKEADILKPIAETNVEFTITLSNKGPSRGTGVVVKDLLPSGFKFLSAATTIGNYDAVTGIWNVGTIDINAVETLKVTAYVLPAGDFTNVAEVIAANEIDIDSTPGNNKLQEDDQDSVTLEPTVPLNIPEGFTPNGDGINDVFEIEHLQVLYPNFSMEIVNRYGNLVYKYKHNGDKFTTPLWWDGYSTGRLNVSGETLPAGTYFYTIHFNNNERKPQTGWVYLKK